MPPPKDEPLNRGRSISTGLNAPVAQDWSARAKALSILGFRFVPNGTRCLSDGAKGPMDLNGAGCSQRIDLFRRETALFQDFVRVLTEPGRGRRWRLLVTDELQRVADWVNGAVGRWHFAVHVGRAHLRIVHR